MCRGDHHSPRRHWQHSPAEAPQTLTHLCLSDEPGNEVLRALKRFFSPRCERYSEADDRILCSRSGNGIAIQYFRSCRVDCGYPMVARNAAT